jgi:hypothetical protein
MQQAPAGASWGTHVLKNSELVANTALKTNKAFQMHSDGIMHLKFSN